MARSRIAGPARAGAGARASCRAGRLPARRPRRSPRHPSQTCGRAASAAFGGILRRPCILRHRRFPIRFLHTADWHLGRVHHGVSCSRTRPTCWPSSFRIAADSRPDAILLAGDVYDRSVPPAEGGAPVDLVLEQLVLELGIPVVMIAGNHDGPDRIAFGSSLLQRAGLTVRGPVEPDAGRWCCATSMERSRSMRCRTPSPRRCAMPAATTRWTTTPPPWPPSSPRQRARQPARARAVVVAHAFVLGGAESESGSRWRSGERCSGAAAFEGFDYVALGHLHRPQAVGAGAGAGDLARRTHPLCGLASQVLVFRGRPCRQSVNLVELDAAGRCAVERIPARARAVTCASSRVSSMRSSPPPPPIRGATITCSPASPIAVRCSTPWGACVPAYPNALAIRRPVLAGDGDGRAAPDHRRLRVQDLFAGFHRDVTGLALDAPETAAARARPRGTGTGGARDETAATRDADLRAFAGREEVDFTRLPEGRAVPDRRPHRRGQELSILDGLSYALYGDTLGWRGAVRADAAATTPTRRWRPRSSSTSRSARVASPRAPRARAGRAARRGGRIGQGARQRRNCPAWVTTVRPGSRSRQDHRGHHPGRGTARLQGRAVPASRRAAPRASSAACSRRGSAEREDPPETLFPPPPTSVCRTPLKIRAAGAQRGEKAALQRRTLSTRPGPEASGARGRHARPAGHARQPGGGRAGTRRGCRRALALQEGRGIEAGFAGGAAAAALQPLEAGKGQAGRAAQPGLPRRAGRSGPPAEKALARVPP